MIRKVLSPLASLRLTVVLLALSMLLVLAGTLAQVRDGVWTVVDSYFRSAFVRVDLQLFVPESVARVPGAILIPGGLTLGVALLVNLIAAHAVRFKFRLRRAGIIITHFGVILLLVGEFVTAGAAEEGRMSIVEGETASYAEDIRRAELAIVDRSDPASDLVAVVPDGVLAHPGRVISRAVLPFDVRVDEWMPNSILQRPGPGGAPAGVGGFGSMFVAAPAPRATGVDGAGVDVASAYVTILQGGRELGRLLVSVHLAQEQQVTVGGKTYWVALRFRRAYKPYEVHLIDFRHDKFVGTETPRNFSSHIRLLDPERGVDREVTISMNHPLRYSGDTLYQAAYLSDNSGTVLQVVRNPGWTIPYISCVLVTAGMLVHFVIRLMPRGRRAAR